MTQLVTNQLQWGGATGPVCVPQKPDNVCSPPVVQSALYA